MPRISPPGGEVEWPAGEGVLGVVGVAPWATLEFCRALYGQVRAGKDWHYPRLLLDVNTKIPSRGRHLQLCETDPSGAIAATITELAAQGATLAVVVSNTAHILYERWARDAPIPVLHIVDETLRLAAAEGATRVAAPVSDSLAQHDLYGAGARAAGLACAPLGTEEQRIVSATIEAVKTSAEIGPALLRDVRRVLEGLRANEVDTVIAGCTELSGLAGACVSLGLRFVDSNVALARSSLARLGVPEALLARRGAIEPDAGPPRAGSPPG